MTIQPSGPLTARIMIVGEFPHEQDLQSNAPFIGGAGYELRKMIRESGFYFEDCYVTMVLKDRVPFGKIGNAVALKKKEISSDHVLCNGKYVLPYVVAGVESLRAEIERVRPNVVVPLGNLALWALTGQWSAQNWRSSVMESTLVPGVKVVPSLNPSQVNVQWKLRPLMVHDLRRAKVESATPALRKPAYNFLVRPTYEEALSAINSYIELAQASLDRGERLKIGGDIETRAGHISCIAFARNRTDAFCIPFMQIGRPDGYWTLEQESSLVFAIYRLCRLVTIVGQNWNYDAQYIFRHWHFICPSVKDTMVQQHSCFSNMEKGLAFLSSMYLDDHLYWKDDRTSWENGEDGEGEDQYWRYNCTDSCRTLGIEEVLCQVVKSLGVEEVDAFQQSLAPVVLRTMNRGLRVDMQKRAGYALRLQEEMLVREHWLKTATGQELNIRSPKQLQDFFYRQMGMKPIINRKTKSVTTDDEALHRIAAREPILAPVTRKISEMRSIGVFHSTFVEAPLDIDGRMRTSFNVCGTDTYRFASRQNAFGTGANLQNIPKGGETEDEGLELPNIRELYIPDQGYTFFDIDLDSADLRVVTGESNCQWMLEQFKQKRKPYVEVMKEYYHDQSMSKDSHPREYAMFKALCHGTNYLGTAEGISPRIGLLVNEVERIQKWYFGLCPEIRAWQEEIKKQVKGRRWISNVFGYKFHFFDRVEGNVFNQAVAWIPQSTVGCLINRAYVNIDRNLPEVEVLLQVHDSLAGQFQSHLGDWALRRIVEESQIVLPYETPLVIPVGVVSSKESWGACR